MGAPATLPADFFERPGQNPGRKTAAPDTLPADFTFEKAAGGEGADEVTPGFLAGLGRSVNPINIGKNIGESVKSLFDPARVRAEDADTARMNDLWKNDPAGYQAEWKRKQDAARRASGGLSGLAGETVGGLLLGVAGGELMPRAMEAAPKVTNAVRAGVKAAAPDVAIGSAKIGGALALAEAGPGGLTQHALNVAMGYPMWKGGAQVFRGLKKGYGAAREGWAGEPPTVPVDTQSISSFYRGDPPPLIPLEGPPAPGTYAAAPEWPARGPLPKPLAIAEETTLAPQARQPMVGPSTRPQQPPAVWPPRVLPKPLALAEETTLSSSARSSAGSPSGARPPAGTAEIAAPMPPVAQLGEPRVPSVSRGTIKPAVPVEDPMLESISKSLGGTSFAKLTPERQAVARSLLGKLNPPELAPLTSPEAPAVASTLPDYSQALEQSIINARTQPRKAPNAPTVSPENEALNQRLLSEAGRRSATAETAGRTKAALPLAKQIQQAAERGGLDVRKFDTMQVQAAAKAAGLPELSPKQAQHILDLLKMGSEPAPLQPLEIH